MNYCLSLEITNCKMKNLKKVLVLGWANFAFCGITLSDNATVFTTIQVEEVIE